MENKENFDQQKKLSNYKIHCEQDLKSLYIKLLNDNVAHLIEHIYDNKTEKPYDVAELRVSMAMQMIVMSQKLISHKLSALISKDINELKLNEEYLNKWANPLIKKNKLNDELTLLRNHTEIDDNISLNLTDSGQIADNNNKFEAFDSTSSVSTLNVSQASVPTPDKCCIQ